jgi:sarcosine reductase
MSDRFELEMASFHVETVSSGGESRLDGSSLEVDLGGLTTSIRSDPGIARVQAELVSPGDPVRIVNVLDAVAPQVKEEDPDATFPGALGTLVVAGRGRTNRLDGVAVISTADLLPSKDAAARDIQDGVIDMLGGGAEYTPWSRTKNLVLTFERDPATPLIEVDAAIRRSTLRVARDLAATTVGAHADVIERIGRPSAGDLPPVCVILQLGGESPLYDTYFYGTSIRGRLPMPVDPTEVLDGAITAGAYHWAALRNPTYCYQRSRLLHELLSAHGSRLDLRGVVITRAYYMGADEKWRNALLAAKLALQMGAHGAILTTDAGGNSHTDTMLTVRACEQLGIRTTVVIAEMGGLTDRVPEADVIVSSGNADELVPEWRPERVIGGDHLVDGRPAADAGPIPVRNYLAATNQMGQTNLRGVTW